MDGLSTMVPDWVNRDMYPFAPCRFDVSAGSMSYVDQGTGKPIVMVHGNPSWSFEFRELIKHFSDSYRCIAPDHIGFGLSDKPAEWDYLPVSHAANLEELLESLDLADVTLVVGDWGGPIGLSYAIEHPERIANVVITNTWFWPVRDDWYYRAFSGFMGGAIGRRLIRNRNFFATTVVRAAYGDKSRLTQEVHRHFVQPLATPAERRGSWVFPGQIIGSSEWLDDLWARRQALDEKVKLVAWGDKDIAFREKELRRWIEAFPSARVVRFPDAGHFLADEVSDRMIAELKSVLAGAGQPSTSA